MDVAEFSWGGKLRQRRPLEQARWEPELAAWHPRKVTALGFPSRAPIAGCCRAPGAPHRWDRTAVLHEGLPSHLHEPLVQDGRNLLVKAVSK